MKASDYIAEELHRQGVPVIFEMIGGMITHLIDSIHLKDQIQIVSVHHEQTAGFAAEAVGRMNGVPGVALATSGPGATNLVTAIGSCYFDSIPTVFITGQVNTTELSTDLPIRQQGFQETDIVSIVKPITKGAWQVSAVDELPEMLMKAFALAKEGRPGPVLLDIPMDIQRMDVEVPDVTVETALFPVSNVDAFSERVAEMFQGLERPLILVGGGVRSAGLSPEFIEMAEASGIPVVMSLMGLDTLPFDHPQRVGMVGTYGNRWANQALMKSDGLLVLGSRLDVRQTGADATLFKEGRPIFHIDCDSGQLNNRVVGCDVCEANLSEALPALKMYFQRLEQPSRSDWRQWVSARREQFADVRELSGCEGINPNELMHQLSRVSSPAAAYVADVGKNQMWAAQSLELQTGQRLLLSGGMGSMGFALPAAIGCVFASNRPVVCIAGDGGMQCNLQELETVISHKLPVKIVVLDNESLGMVGQFQEDYFESRMRSTVWGYSAPNFEAVALAYGIEARALKSPEETEEALAWLWADPNTPALLHVKIDVNTKVFPKAAYGRAIDDMDPKLD